MPLSAISWRPVLVVEEAEVPGGIMCESVISDVVIKKYFLSFTMDKYIIHRFISKLSS
jgi:hypothetical protein